MSESRTFKTTQDAFEHACNELNPQIEPEQPMVALVLDSAEEFGADEAITIEDSGNARLTLKVASKDGGFVVLSRTIKPPKESIAPGDLVCWVPLKHDPQLAAQASDDRFGWIGLVFATLEPQWEEDEWALREFYE